MAIGKLTKVLIVDDQKLVTQLITAAVQSLNIVDIDIAFNGREAFSKYEAALSSKPYDMIICDMDMPLMNGMEFLKLVRLQDKDVAIMMLSANTTQKAMSEAKAAGANYYFLKPIDIEILSLKLMAAMEVRTA